MTRGVTTVKCYLHENRLISSLCVCVCVTLTIDKRLHEYAVAIGQTTFSSLQTVLTYRFEYIITFNVIDMLWNWMRSIDRLALTSR